MLLILTLRFTQRKSCVKAELKSPFQALAFHVNLSHSPLKKKGPKSFCWTKAEDKNLGVWSVKDFPCSFVIGLIFRIISEAAQIWAKPPVIDTSFSALTLYCITWLSFQNVFFSFGILNIFT